MLVLTILSVFVLLVIGIIIYEIRNERKYQEKRRTRREKDNKQGRQKFSDEVKLTQKPKAKKPQKNKEALQKKSHKKEKKLPTCIYPKFTHVRLVDMGLSDEEAKEFVEELIPQIETQIPLIEKELTIPDFHQMERLTHSLKGSATNLGTGGISDLLVECNTYLKTGTDIDIATTYFGYLKHYTQELKEQYA